MTTSLNEQLSALDAAESTPLAFQIELADAKRPVKTYLWRGESSPTQDIHLCIYTHGAGGTCISPASSRLCEGLVESTETGVNNNIVALGFDGAMHLGSRTKSFVALIKWAAESSKVTTISLAGRSMGCRAATIAAGECTDLPKLSRKLVLQSYPLRGAGKGTKDAERKQVLLDLPADMSILFQSGDQDEMCPLDELRELRKTLKAGSSLVSLQRVDHGLQLVSGTAPRGSKSILVEEVARTAAHVACDWLLAESVAKLGDGVIQVETVEEDSAVTWSEFGDTDKTNDDDKQKQTKRPVPEDSTAAKKSPKRAKRTKQ